MHMQRLIFPRPLFFSAFCLAAALASSAGAALADVPPAAKESLKRAHGTDDPFVMEATLEAALARYPDEAAALRAFAAGLEGPDTAAQAAGAPEPSAATGKTASVETPTSVGGFFTGWSGEAEAGATVTSGNTDRQNALARFALERDRARWRTKLNGKLIYAKEEGEQTEEEYTLGTRLDRKLDERRFYFGQLTATRDEFSGYDYRITEIVGYGQRFTPWSGSELELTGGIGGRHSRQSDGTENHEPVAKAGLDFEWKINGGLTFVQTGEATVGSELTVTETETALKTRLAENWQMKAGIETTYVTEVPPGDRNLDTRTAVTLLYGF